MSGLNGVAVLVTRPELQATPLCRILESEGALAIRLPALQIESTVAPAEVAPYLPALDAVDLVIFTSANAVNFAASLIGRIQGAAVAAIGPATARALDRIGVQVTVTPTDGFDSETLLLHSELLHPVGRRVLIIKGKEGRELLQTELTTRGAHVTVAEVYARVPAHHSVRNLEMLGAKFTAGEIDVVTATSVDLAVALLGFATPAMRRGFDSVHWLVPSARVASAVRALGIKAPMIEADSARDHDLVTALKRWRAMVSGA